MMEFEVRTLSHSLGSSSKQQTILMNSFIYHIIVLHISIWCIFAVELEKNSIKIVSFFFFFFYIKNSCKYIYIKEVGTSWMYVVKKGVRSLLQKRNERRKTKRMRSLSYEKKEWRKTGRVAKRKSWYAALFWWV